MTTEAAMLVLAATLSLALGLLTVGIHVARFGGPVIRGNHEGYPALTGAAGRVTRAHANLNEALLPFAIVVLVAMVLKVSNPVTAGAAAVFVAARIAHASLYVAGVPIWRSVAFYLGLVATGVLAGEVLRAAGS